MPSLDAQLGAALQQWRADGLYREVRTISSAQGPHVVIDGREYLNFSSNDYLGLANDPILKRAAQAALERYGVGAGASRLVCGNLEPYDDLERKLAAYKAKEAAIVFSTGYAANIGTLSALLEKGDVVILDKLDHASIIDGVRQSGATIRVYPHKNLAKLEEILRQSERFRRKLIVTETVFSMDGDTAPLAEIVALKKQYGAWLMIDEAHGTGIYGRHRRGLAEAAGVEDEIDISLGTLSKALGAAGGYVAGTQTLIDYLRNRARGLIYSTALPPVVCAAAAAAVDLVMSEEGHQRQDRLWRNVSEMKNGLSQCGFPNESRSPIIPVIVGAERAAVETSQRLFEQGIYVPAIRFPTVPKGKARLRVTVTAAHAPADIQRFLNVLRVTRPPGRGGDAAPTSSGTVADAVVGAASPPRPGQSRPPHSTNLRKGRVSLPGECYFVTTGVEGKRPIFINPAAPPVVIDALRWLRDQGRIRLLGFVVMPDHVHVALALAEHWTLPQIMHSLKSYTAHRLGRLLDTPGSVWQGGYDDHHLRERRDYDARLAYMHDNPVREGLVRFSHEYPFSTAHHDYQPDIDWAWLDGIGEAAGRGGDATPTTTKNRDVGAAPTTKNRDVGAASPPRPAATDEVHESH